MTTRFAKVNGVHIAYRVHGEGPPLVLVMGYRLSSAAWPRTFVEGLARRIQCHHTGQPGYRAKRQAC